MYWVGFATGQRRGEGFLLANGVGVGALVPASSQHILQIHKEIPPPKRHVSQIQPRKIPLKHELARRILLEGIFRISSRARRHVAAGHVLPQRGLALFHARLQDVEIGNVPDGDPVQVFQDLVRVAEEEDDGGQGVAEEEGELEDQEDGECAFRPDEVDGPFEGGQVRRWGRRMFVRRRGRGQRGRLKEVLEMAYRGLLCGAYHLALEICHEHVAEHGEGLEVQRDETPFVLDAEVCQGKGARGVRGVGTD